MGVQMVPFVKIFIIVAAFAVFHSLTARESVRFSARQKTGLSHAAYAAVRAAISLALLIFSLLILFQEGVATTQLFAPHLGLPAILPSLFTCWLAGMALGQIVKARRLPQFFGFEEFPKLFIYTGAYAICRHPMYTAWLTAAWGLLISKPYLLTVFYNFLVTGFVVYAALQEERQMIALFGDKYRAYQKQIPFLLPYGFLKPRIRKEGAPRF
jgi:protein-S-isoprenylcysteine O-methyltransferase Ste14